MRDNSDYLAQVCMGNRLRALRLRRGMTQMALARALGFAHPSSVSSIEKGRRPVNDEELAQIARMLRCSVGALLGPEKPTSKAT